MCAGNVTWRGRSVQCCTCSTWVHLKCSLLSFSRFRTLGSSHSWSYVPASGDPTPTNAVTSSSDFCLYTSTVQSGPPLPMQHFRLRLQTSYPPSARFVFSPSAPSPPPHAPGCLSTPAFSSPPDSIRDHQCNAGGLRAGSIELLHFIQEFNFNSFSSFRILCSAI